MLESSLKKLQCNLDDLELSATFNSQNSPKPKQLPKFQTDEEKSSSTSLVSDRSTHQSSRQYRLETDEEQIYIIARNTHLALHTLLINAK